MKWKFYWRDIVSKYHVMIEGWPLEIPLGNLSDVATSLPVLERLRHLWNTDKITFRSLNDAEFQKLDEQHSVEIENGEVNPPVPRKIRSDKGKKRKGGDKGDRPKKRVKSKAVVDSDCDDSDKENEVMENPKKQGACVTSKWDVRRDNNDNSGDGSESASDDD